MSYVVVAPNALTAAAANVATINSSLKAANAAAALPIVWVPGSAGDQVSKAIATLFSEVGQEFQTLLKEAQAVADQIVQALNQAGEAFREAEVLSTQVLTPSLWPAAVADASGASPPPRTDPLGTVMYELNQTSQRLVGEPLFFNGANGTQASPNGQNGGLLIGNGGNGWNSTVAGVNGGNGGTAGILGNGGNGGTGGPGAIGVAPGTGGNGGAAVWVGNGGAGGAGWNNSTISGVNGGNGGVGGQGGFYFGVGGAGGAGGSATDATGAAPAGPGATWASSGAPTSASAFPPA
ncbi:PE family protein, partial [Mycobacterium interjectum]|uniref:PE family protein n=1 Tax=Mycobacterium interjectum TaxID=33895 RepID=UPI0021F304AE